MVDKLAAPSVTQVSTNFKVGKKLGGGCFGVVCLGTNTENNAEVAIKFEPMNCQLPSVEMENQLYKRLQGPEGFPKSYYFGSAGKYRCMVLDLLGNTLEKLWENKNKKFSLKTVTMIAIQTIVRMAHIHNKGLLYRDVKPENFMVGLETIHQSHIVFVIDLGLCCDYIVGGKHISNDHQKILTGTARYMSINVHNHETNSRRDDLEALGYMFMYFLLGRLPWQGLKADTPEHQFTKIGQVKKDTPLSKLCDGFPEEYSDFIAYCRTIKFDERPDYKKCLSYFVDLMKKQHWAYDAKFDWVEYEPPAPPRPEVDEPDVGQTGTLPSPATTKATKPASKSAPASTSQPAAHQAQVISPSVAPGAPQPIIINIAAPATPPGAQLVYVPQGSLDGNAPVMIYSPPAVLPGQPIEGTGGNYVQVYPDPAAYGTVNPVQVVHDPRCCGFIRKGRKKNKPKTN